MAKIVHFDIQGEDPAKLIPFYEKAFGWKFSKCAPETCGGVDYWLIETGSKEEPGIGGGLSKTGEGPAVNTIGVENIDKAIEGTKANGGSIVNEKCHMPGVGWLAYFKDPQGNTWGLIQEEKKE